MQYRSYYNIPFKKRLLVVTELRGSGMKRSWATLWYTLFQNMPGASEPAGIPNEHLQNKSGANMLYFSCRNNVKCWRLTNCPRSAFVVLQCPQGVAEVSARKFPRKAAALNCKPYTDGVCLPVSRKYSFEAAPYRIRSRLEM